MDIKRDRKENDNNIPCPVCGDGEVMNPNHFVADYAIGRRYETCLHTVVASGHCCGAQRPLCGLTATPI